MTRCSNYALLVKQFPDSFLPARTQALNYAGEEKRAWYLMFAHAIDIVAFILPMTFGLTRIVIFTRDDLEVR